MKTKDIVLVGIPRGGTTLSCHLVNKLSDAVALNEPLQPPSFKNNNSAEILEKIQYFFREQRSSLLQNGTAVSKTQGGKVPDNPLQGSDESTGSRTRVIDSRVLEIEKTLPDEFYLMIKHNAFFAAIIDELVKSYNCFAIIRHPLSVLLSWNSVTFPISKGYAPAAEMFDKELERMLRTEPDKTKRQIKLLTWYYDQINEYVPASNIIKYEDIISTGGSALKIAFPSATFLDEPLNSKNKNPLYDKSLIPEIVEELLNVRLGGYLNFYTKESIRSRLI